MWQALHAEIAPRGGAVVTVALDVLADRAAPWVQAAAPSHPSVLDASHVTDELLGFVNVPMAVWVDEHGRIVRPAERASIDPPPPDTPVPEGLPERLGQMMVEVRKIPRDGPVYRSAILDWIDRGPDSPYVLSPDTVVARSAERPATHARAAACFELGHALFQRGGTDAAAPWWREAHRSYPENWTYKRQAWTLVTTPEGQPSDLIQGPNDVYEGNWLDDVVAAGGGDRYYPERVL